MIKEVTKGIYRGSQEDISEKLLTKNIKSILKLNADDMMDEYRFCEKNDIEFCDVVLSEFKKPSKRDLDALINIIKNNYMVKLRPLFIHCKHGHERTGIVIAHYRMKIEGWSKWKAIKEALQEGFSPLFLWWFL